MSIALRLSGLVRSGDLLLKLPGAVTLRLGDGQGTPLALAITNPKWVARIASNPGLAMGEAYVEGELQIEQGSLSDFLDLIGRNLRARPRRRIGPLERCWRDALAGVNNRRRARRNVAHHYDLSLDLYRRFLDADLQYSCAYFRSPHDTLEEAQAEKKRRLAAKLWLRAGHTVLDIGCGWGGLSLSLARSGAVQAHGVTLSEEQLEVARERARSEGLAGRVRFSLTDYRDLSGPYDRIVSVGMLEHVGRSHYHAYFRKVASLLADDGVAVVHTIARPEGPGATQPWIAKYVFPGGYIPALSELLPAIERSGLIVTDIEVLRLHYAETLRRWRERFAAHRAEIAQLYDERFCRLWEFYLGLSEVAFRYRDHTVVQIQLAKRIDVLPLARGYMEGTADEVGAAFAPGSDDARGASPRRERSAPS